VAATITEVARHAGVGVGTVSRVINSKGYGAPVTLARVEASIAELQWVPRHAARTLRANRTQSVAVVVPYLTGASISERLRGIEAALVDADLDMLAASIEKPGRRAAVLGRIAHRGRIDGLLLVSLPPTHDELAGIRATGIPLVLVDAYHRSVPRVIIDDTEGGAIAARHLLELGHRRIGFVGDENVPGFRFSSSRLRFLGVGKAMREAGVAIPDGLVGLGAPTRAGARAVAGRILAGPEPPTAILAASDLQALGVLGAARERGIDVPGRLSVIGFDDVEVADFAGLTTIHQPLERSGQRGVQRLLDLIEGRPVGRLREVLEVHLVVRATTGPRPA
jgi:DNA-binding LacI/PurR family transcriptional regulator